MTFRDTWQTGLPAAAPGVRKAWPRHAARGASSLLKLAVAGQRSRKEAATLCRPAWKHGYVWFRESRPAYHRSEASMLQRPEASQLRLALDLPARVLRRLGEARGSEQLLLVILRARRPLTDLLVPLVGEALHLDASVVEVLQGDMSEACQWASDRVRRQGCREQRLELTGGSTDK